MDSMTKQTPKSKVQIGNRNGLTFKLVPIKNSGEIKSPSIAQIDDLIYVDVYEGYKKLGRFKLGNLRLKFG